MNSQVDWALPALFAEGGADLEEWNIPTVDNNMHVSSLDWFGTDMVRDDIPDRNVPATNPQAGARPGPSLSVTAMPETTEYVIKSLREMSSWARDHHWTVKEALQMQTAKCDDLSRRLITAETSLLRLPGVESYGPRLVTVETRLASTVLQVETLDKTKDAQDRRLAELRESTNNGDRRIADLEKQLIELKTQMEELRKEAEERRTLSTKQDNHIQDLRRCIWKMAKMDSSRSRGRMREEYSRDKSRGRADGLPEIAESMELTR